MKLLLVFLACFAAANALSYRDYCQRKFVVFPSTYYYRYSIYFSSSWCSSSYYAPILKVYPGKDCGTEGWKESSVTDLVNEASNCLNTALHKMSSQMYAKRNEWEKKICEIHEEYKANFKKYITRYYDYQYQCAPGPIDTAERDAKIKEYNEKLDKLKAEYVAKYNSAIAAKIEAIKAYHAKILKAATECLVNRNKKISEYKGAAAKKILENITKFAQFHLAIAEKKREYYKSILSSLFGSSANWFTEFKADIAVRSYYAEERKAVEKLVRIYSGKLVDYQKKLITYYTCAYRCYLSNACLRFYKRSYYSSCRSLAPCYTYKTGYCLTRYCIRPFNVYYRPTTYKCLRTCDIDADADSADKLIEELNKKMEEVLKKRAEQFMSWKSKWIVYHGQYKAKYAAIVKQRHDLWLEYVRKQYLACSKNGLLTPEQLAKLAQLKKELDEKAAEACRKYAESLAKQIAECVSNYLKEVAAYKKSVADLITKVQAQFDACSAKRKEAIAAYQKKLEESRDAKRVALTDSMLKVKNAHFSEFHKMLKHYHGEKYLDNTWITFMVFCYKTVLMNKCRVVLSQFDQNWKETLPKLVMHYACGYKCNVRAYLPSYKCGSYYTWAYKMPTYSCYTYKYSYYRRYCY